ncbi:unnamed protein product [Discosporangium mesarthrocarpum]
MARRLLGLARGKAVLEVFLAWRGLARGARTARLGAEALASRSMRCRRRDHFRAWRSAVATTRSARAAAVDRLFTMARLRAHKAFYKWKTLSLGWVAWKGKAAAALARLSGMVGEGVAGRARLGRAMALWRERTTQGSALEAGGVGVGEVALFAWEAAEAFSLARSIPEVFRLAREFVERAVPGSSGHLFLLDAGSGEVFTLSAGAGNHAGKVCVGCVRFPAGPGLVGACLSRGVACQALDPSCRTLLPSQADVFGLSMPPTTPAAGVGIAPRGTHSEAGTVSPRPRHTRQKGLSMTPSPPLSWVGTPGRAARGNSQSPSPDSKRGSDQGPAPVAGSRRRLAFFPATSSPPPSPPMFPALPGGDRGGWEVGLARGGGPGLGLGWGGIMSRPVGEWLEAVCVPVLAGAVDGTVMGVLKVGEETPGREMAVEGGIPEGASLSPEEMAAVSICAAQVSATVRRVNLQLAPLEEEPVATHFPKKHRCMFLQVTSSGVKQDLSRLQAEVKQVSGETQVLEGQRDEAREAYAKVKGRLKRMEAALSELRDRQLGFRHYHDLIVSMSKTVLGGEGDTSEAALANMSEKSLQQRQEEKRPACSMSATIPSTAAEEAAQRLEERYNQTWGGYAAAERPDMRMERETGGHVARLSFPSPLRSFHPPWQSTPSPSPVDLRKEVSALAASSRAGSGSISPPYRRRAARSSSIPWPGPELRQRPWS